MTMREMLKKLRGDNPPKCDRCSVVVGLYQHNEGKWRCPACIWDERTELIEEVLHLLDIIRFSPLDDEIPIINRNDIRNLQKIIDKINF